MTSRYVFTTSFFVFVGVLAGWLNPVNCHAQETEEQGHKIESGIYYTIQKGDTLWGLSERFFDSPWVWPDLWEKNKEIANPHWIYPNNRIRIFSREGLEVEEPPKPEPKVEASRTVEPLGELPPAQVALYYPYPAVNRVGFIRKNPVKPCGAVFKVREGTTMIDAGDTVYVRPEPEGEGDCDLKEGQWFTVFRTSGRVKDRETGDVIGIPHHMLGVVEIVQVEPKFSICRVVKSFRAIYVSDLLMPYEELDKQIPVMAGKAGLTGKIIMSEAHDKRIMGHEAIVFIDKGLEHGVRVGQAYSTYYREKGYLDPKDDEAILLPPVDFGRILILRTEATTATALVHRAVKAIEPGTKIRPFNPMPEKRTEEAME
jgi:hypothetical protein